MYIRLINTEIVVNEIKPQIDLLFVNGACVNHYGNPVLIVSSSLLIDVLWLVVVAVKTNELLIISVSDKPNALSPPFRANNTNTSPHKQKRY